MDLDPDRLMWIEIKAGLLGFKKALEFSTRLGPGAGIAMAALGRVVKAIDRRWNLGEPDKETRVLPKVELKK